MTNKKQVIFSLTILLSIFGQTTFGQNLKDIKLDNKQSILNDKAFFVFPTDAKNKARSADLMSTDYNINQETRIVLDIDKMKIVFFAQELFLFGNNNLLEEVTKEKNEENFKIKTLNNKDQLLSILSTPIAFDSTKNAILVNSLLVKTQDNSVFRIDAYINPDAYRVKNELVELTEQIFQTLMKGTRANNINARVETHNIFGTKKDFNFNLPENYCITIDQKYDFQVFKFHKYKNYSDTNWISMTVYTGNHPSYFFREYGFDQSSTKWVTNEFLGKKVDWLSFHNADKQIYLKEQQIPCDKISKGLIVHIAMLSNSDISIDELTKIVESIKLK